MSFRTLAAACAAALIAAAPSAHAAEWKRLDSEHFTLTTNIGTAPATRYLEQLEAFRWLALQVLGADGKGARAQARFEIVMLQGQEALKGIYPHLSDNAAGAYTYCAEGNLAVGTFESGRRGQDFNQIVLQHEYAHHLMFQYATVGYPAWFVEGFAEFMATASAQEGQVSLGGMYQGRANTLLSGAWLPYEDVLRWHLRPYPANDVEVQFFYAQSWLLAHYMLSDATRARRLAEYHARVAAGEDPVAAFEPATGIPVAELRKLLHPYSFGVPKFTVQADDLPRARIEVTPLGDDAHAYLPHALALRSCVKPENGQAILARLRAAMPRPEQARPAWRLALARAESRFGDAAAAVALLDPIAAAEPQNAEAQYLLGRAWLRRAEPLGGDAQAEARERARGHLFKAYRLNKNDAPTLYQLARLLAREGADPNAVNAARAARRLAPGVAEYATLQASLDLQVGDREGAVRALTPLANNPHARDSAARMRRAIEAIRAGQSAQEVGALIDPPR